MKFFSKVSGFMGNSYGGISSVIAEFRVRDSDPQGGEAFYAAPF
ncbi:hypothetical protein [uncultured Fibrobacter sp.]|nr:hypothetical protein [uncultured Fibrobacter sp.]